MQRGLLLSIIVLLLSTPGRAAETPILNVYNWSDYIDPSILEQFESEYGIDINYDIYDSSEIVDTKLMTGGSGYDIVVHSASASARLIPIGIYRAVEFERLQNWHNIDPDIIDKISANYGEQMAGVPYMWGPTGFSYNVDMIRERMPDAPVNSAAMLFDPDIVSRFADCGVSLLDAPGAVIPMAMLYLGHPANSVEPEHLADVEKLIKAVRPFLKYFSSTKLMLDLPSQEVCIAMSWSGDYSIATARAAEVGLDIDLGYSMPLGSAYESAPALGFVYEISVSEEGLFDLSLLLGFWQNKKIILARQFACK